MAFASSLLGLAASIRGAGAATTEAARSLRPSSAICRYENGCSKAHIVALLGVSEGTVRYHVKRIQSGATTADQARRAVLRRSTHWQASQGEGPIN